MERTIRRGDIYYADLNPVIGSEQGGTRPVLIISNDTGNKYSPTVIICRYHKPKYTQKKKLPTHLYLGQIEGLPANSIVLFEQLRTIDKSRLKEQLTHLDEQYLKSFEFPLLISIGVEKKEELMNFVNIYELVLKEYPDILTVDEMSKALGVSTKTGYQLLRENKIEHLKVGRAYRVPKAHLLSYLRLGLRNAEN